MAIPMLSEVEQEVALLVAGGHSHREIADALKLSLKTVEWHAARASRKLERAVSLHDRLREADPHGPTSKGGQA